MSSPSPTPPVPSPFSRVKVVAEAGSTNTDLVAAVLADDAAWPHLSVLRAEHQVAGRGRTGRAWTTPAGTALTFSVVIRPRRPPAEWATLSLVSGLAVVRALRTLPGPEGRELAAALKWPNDVLLLGTVPDGVAPLAGWGSTRKVAGILAETVPGRDALVVGIGVNLAQRGEADLPVPWATSVALAGASTTPDQLLLAIGTELAALLERWESEGFEALRPAVVAVTDTVGREVEVDLGAVVVRGRAIDVAADGRLHLITADGEPKQISAGDVVHARRT